MRSTLARPASDSNSAAEAQALTAQCGDQSNLRGKDLDQALDALPQSARQDLREAGEAYRQYRVGWLSRATRRAYDKYLQAQGIREGIRGYSHGIELLGYAWRKGIVKQ